MSKPPTPQAISVLLRKAGFQRSESHPTEVKDCPAWSEGYVSAGDSGVVQVRHKSGDGGRYDAGHHAVMLARYREAIEAAGWTVQERDDPGFAPRLIVTAKQNPDAPQLEAK